MKKIVLLLSAIACLSAAQSQFVVGLQGGYYWQKSGISLTDDYITSTHLVGGLQLGYMITPRLYFGVAGGYMDAKQDTLVATDRIYYGNVGMDIDVVDHYNRSSRTGWYVAPQLKYEFLRFGNMHFNVLLQGQVRMMGPINYLESYYALNFPNPGEYHEYDPSSNNTDYFSWSVSLRPTLVYEISPNINVELMLDVLSVGYTSETSTYDPGITGVDPISTYHNTLYAGLNTFGDVLRWEHPLFKLGFNFTF